MPISTARPSSSELDIMMSATTRYAIRPPLSRAVTSNISPRRRASDDTVEMISPEAVFAVMAGPVFVEWWPIRRATPSDDCSQLDTAIRCRRVLDAACTSARPSRPRHQGSTAAGPFSRPASIARPSRYGQTAWASIHSTPKNTPPKSVAGC